MREFFSHHFRNGFEECWCQPLLFWLLDSVFYPNRIFFFSYCMQDLLSPFFLNWEPFSITLSKVTNICRMFFVLYLILCWGREQYFKNNVWFHIYAFERVYLPLGVCWGGRVKEVCLHMCRKLVKRTGVFSSAERWFSFHQLPSCKLQVVTHSLCLLSLLVTGQVVLNAASCKKSAQVWILGQSRAMGTHSFCVTGTRGGKVA